MDGLIDILLTITGLRAILSAAFYSLAAVAALVAGWAVCCAVPWLVKRARHV